VDRHTLERLVEAATRAPSADNGQPWRFHYHRGRLDVHHDVSRALRFDTHCRASLLAVGAALENLTLAARALGWEPGSEDFPDDRQPDLVARLEFEPTVPLEDALHPFIVSRTTNRRPYALTPPGGAAERELAEAVARFESVELRITTRRGVIRESARLVMEADALRYRQRAFHEELFRAIRFPSAGATPADGLPLEVLEAGRLGGAVLRLARPWRRARLLHRVGLARLMALHSYLAVLRSGAVALLVTREAGRTGWVRAGRALERLWLQATALGLAVQPLSPGTLLLLDIPERRLASRLAGLRTRLEALFGVAGATPVALLRLGRARPPSARAPRRGVGEVLAVTAG
jgi:nitroreductase